MNNPIKNIDPTGLYECTGLEKECNKFAAGLQKANDQLAKIEKRYGKESAEYKDAVRALNSYGCDAAVCGDVGKNGVSVGFRKLSGKTLGSTIGTMINTGANTINVTIDLEKNGSDSNLLTTIAHEGSHVADNSDFQGAMLAASNISEAAVNAVLSGPLRVTHGQTETRAYGVSSVFSEFVMGGGEGKPTVESSGGTTTFNLNQEPVKASEVGGEDVWKSSWQKLDIDTIRSKRSTAISKGLPKSEYKPVLNKFIQ